MKQLSVPQYAKKHGVTGEAVRKKLRAGQKLKDVKKVTMIGKMYLLTLK